MSPVDTYLKEIEKLVGGVAYTLYDTVSKKCPFDKENRLFLKQLLWYFYIYFGNVSIAKALEIEELAPAAVDVIVHDECIRTLLSFRDKYGEQ